MQNGSPFLRLFPPNYARFRYFKLKEMNRFFAEKCTIGVAGRTPESYETLSNTLIFMMQDKNHENVIFGAKNDVSRLKSHE